MPDTEHQIQIAGPSDAPALAKFARRTFLDAFAAQNAPEFIDRYVDEAFSQQAVRTELAQSANTFLFIRNADALQAYMKLRTGPAPECVSGRQPVEVHRLYVDKRSAPPGLGTTLMNAGLEHAHQTGSDVAWLGVWSENEGALRFYRRLGFERVGQQDFMMGSERQIDWILQREY